MPCYIVSYDLRKGKERDYESLYEAIRAYGTWARITESTWALVSANSAVEVREDLATHMDADDRLFVGKSGGEAAWQNVMCKNTWLKEYL